MAEISPLRRRMIEDMTVRNLVSVRGGRPAL